MGLNQKRYEQIKENEDYILRREWVHLKKTRLKKNNSQEVLMKEEEELDWKNKKYCR